MTRVVCTRSDGTDTVDSDVSDKAILRSHNDCSNERHIWSGYNLDLACGDNELTRPRIKKERYIIHGLQFICSDQMLLLTFVVQADLSRAGEQN